MKEVEIYTDGACSGNPGDGGWGTILIYKGKEKILSGYEKDTTNNRMELLAAIKGLEELKEKCRIKLYSDSAYLVNAFTEGWIESWVNNGWTRGKNKKEIKNLDLWKRLYDLSLQHSVEWVKVKGHSDNEYNNRCDKLATDEIAKNRSKEMEYYEETIKVERKYTGNIINVEKLTVRLPDGKEATRDVVRHPGASVVVPVTDDKSLLLVTQFRKPNNMVSLELPAGKLDNGEDPEMCAKRELHEETGFISGKLVKLLSIHSTPGFSDEVLHMYLASDLIEDKACPDADEFISCKKYSITDCINMVADGKITDAKTIIGVFIAEKIIKGEYKIS